MIKKNYIGLIFLISSHQYIWSQSVEKNYLTIKTPLEPTSTYQELDNLLNSNKRLTTTYKDGLGRNTQTINHHFNLSESKDLVSFNMYNNLGQNNKNYLPYCKEDNFGDFVTDALNEQETYYNNTSDIIANTSKAFSETLIEASPYKRVLKAGSVGLDWQLDQHHVKMEFASNIENEVLFWKVNSSAPYIASALNNDNSISYFHANTLSKSVTTDVNNKNIAEFTNGLGQLICRKVYAKFEMDANGNYYTIDNTNGTNSLIAPITPVELSTYYIYNDIGQLIFEIPAIAIKEMNSNFVFGDEVSINQNIFKELIYAFHYDEKNRLTEKHVPGTIGSNTLTPGWHYFVYNQLGQIILSQDPNQKANNWTFNKYDSKGRVIITGKYNNTSSRFDLQGILNDNFTTIFWEDRNTGVGNIHGYTNLTYPSSVSDIEIYSVNYYDDYNFDIENRTFQVWEDNIKSNHTRGLITGSKVKILGSSPVKYLLLVNYYDKFARIIQSHAEHHKHGWDVYNNKYNFTGQVTKSQRDHAYSGNDPLTILNRYTYDHQGRSIYQFQQIGNDPEIILIKNSYNELGQLIKKQLHNDAESSDYIQNIDYRYNEKGWLTNINNSPIVDDGGLTNNDINDVFGEEILYNKGEILNSSGILAPNGIHMTNQFDGNIASIKWMTKDPTSDGTILSQNCYVYRYDDLGRMTGGYYASDGNKGSTSDIFNKAFHAYDEKVSYDINGNIIYLKRMNRTIMDELKYSYNSKSNRLKAVLDVSTDPYNSSFPQFINGSNLNEEYTYDKNGSQIFDANKGLTTTYNYLNLPVKVVKNIGLVDYYVTFTYDAKGKLLSKKLTTHPDGENIPRDSDRDYINGIEYDGSNGMLYIATAEGIIRKKSATANNATDYVYDYYIKDHLGNVRAIITNENATYTEGEVYVSETASMEMSNDPEEEEYFDNLDETRKNKTPDYPYNPNDPYNSKVSKLGTALGTTVGPSTVLAVKQGDELSVSTEYYFTTPNEPQTNQTAAQILAGIVGNIATAGIGVLPTDDLGAVINPFEDGGSEATGILNNFISSSFDTLDLTLPQGYLVYLFFDNKMNLDPTYSGVERVTEAGSLQQLAVMNQKMPADGFYYTYVTNQSQKSMQFDNFTYIHIEGQLREVNDYYPYGMLCSSATISDYSKTKFQSKELNSKEFAGSWGLDWYNHGARMYDPEIGRWHVQDPLVHNRSWVTPYNFVQNNPVARVDPTGTLDFVEIENNGRAMTNFENPMTDGWVPQADGTFAWVDNKDVGELFATWDYGTSTVFGLADGSLQIFLSEVEISGNLNIEKLGEDIMNGGWKTFIEKYENLGTDFFFNSANAHFNDNSTGPMLFIRDHVSGVGEATRLSQMTHTWVDGSNGNGWTEERNKLEHHIGMFLISDRYGWEKANQIGFGNEIRGLLINDRQSGNMLNALLGQPPLEGHSTAFEWSDFRHNSTGIMLWKGYHHIYEPPAIPGDYGF
jgi:RHS repeat-associated protein